FFFFQAEDGIRDFHVTGVQTCALPIFTKTASEPMPSWPFELSPQHTSTPSVRTAQVCRAPAETCVACRPPTTGATPADRTVVPWPSWPWVPAPHPRPALSSAIAQACGQPAPTEAKCSCVRASVGFTSHASPVGRERAGVTVARRDLLEELGRVDQRGHVAVLRRPAVAELATLACAPAEGLSLRRDRARVLDAGIQRDVVAECATRAERIVAGGKRQQCQQG